MITAIFLFIALGTPPDAAAKIVDNTAYSHRGFREVLLRCPDQVWPGFAWNDLQFLFSEPNSKSAWLISAQSGSPEEIRKDQTLEDIFEPGFKFGFLDFRGRRTIVLNTENLSPEQSFRLSVRELFKYVGQSSWSNPNFDNRGTLYPLLAEPRYLRRMAFENLKSAYSDLAGGSDPRSHLSAAAYWLRRWQRVYPEELPMQTDSLEGTARYVEQVAFLRGKIGCEAHGKDFFSAYEKYLLGEMDISARESLVGEGFPMGAIASFFLTATNSSWFGKMNGLVMPTELALQGVHAVRQEENDWIRGTYIYEVQKQQRRAKRKLRRYFDHEFERDYVRVSIPSNWQKNGLPVVESYVLRDRRDTTLLLLNKETDFSEEHGLIRLPEAAVIVLGPRNPCGGLFHFLLPAKAVSQQGTRFIGTHKHNGISLNGTKKSRGGFTWICPAE